MNSELVKQEIEKIIASEVNAAWRQYPAGVAQKEELTELGIIDLMPADFGHADAKVILEALQEKVTGNFDDVVTFKSKLMELINEVEENINIVDETDYDENEAYFYSEQQQAIETELNSLMEDEYQVIEEEAKRFNSDAGNITLYVPRGYKSKAEYLAEKLNLKDARGNYSVSALFRYLIDQELMGDAKIQIGDLVGVNVHVNRAKVVDDGYIGKVVSIDNLQVSIKVTETFGSCTSRKVDDVIAINKEEITATTNESDFSTDVLWESLHWDEM